MKYFKLFLAAAVTALLTSCVVDYGYHYYTPTYSTPVWENPRVSFYSPYYSNISRPRNVIPFDGGLPACSRGRVFRGGDGFLYLEQH